MGNRIEHGCAGNGLVPCIVLDIHSFQADENSFSATGAVGMFPRLAFVTLSDNLMILSLRSMLSEFFSELRVSVAHRAQTADLPFRIHLVLMGIAGFCFIGFAYALWTLGGGKFAWSTIAWYLLEVYFGLDASGFEAAGKWSSRKPIGPDDKGGLTHSLRISQTNSTASSVQY